ncbi:MAG: DUF1570 domain-containing protein [Planctomycetota bacterium]|nr:DUF1570 domain-containing protein [Planctomycetota bacterium]MDA1137568.1 DUF1570 domain-containing protein [Planctomycetota bacterium]
MKVPKFFILACILATEATADIVFLNNGGKFEGTVIEDGDKIIIVTNNGARIPLPLSDVKSISRKQLPEEEYRKRLESLDRTSAKAVYQLALWCKANEFNEEHEKLLEDVIELEPDHAKAKEILYSYQKTYRRLPSNNEAEAKLESELGQKFNVVRTQHFRIAYDTDSSFADNRGQLFESVYRAFYGFFEKRNFPLKTMQDRMEVVLFDSHSDFLNYARKRSPMLESSAGFYSPMENRVAFFNSLNAAGYEQQRQAILEAEARIKNQRKELSNSRATKFTFTDSDGNRKVVSKSGAMNLMAKEERKVRDQRRKLTSYYKNENVTTTVHECLHQLAFNLGVQEMKGDVPKWIGEGLATFFETASYGSLLQIGQVNKERLEFYHRIRQAGPLIPMEVMVGRDEIYDLSSPGAASAAYAQGWGMVHYFFEKKEKEFLQFLQMLNKKNGNSDPPVRIRDFEAAFGNLKNIEQDWVAYMDGLK